MSNGGGGGGSLAQLGNQSIGQSIGFGISAALASDDWDRWKRSLRKGPSYRMQGLARAGLNPILAVGGGLGGGMPGPAASHATAGGGPGSNPDLAQKQSSLFAATTARELATANRTNIQATVDQANADYWTSPEGRATIAQGARNKALPSTLTGAGIRLLDSLRGTGRAKDIVPPQNLRPRRNQEFIVPRGNRNPEMGLP